MKNKEIAQIFYQMAELSEIKGEILFKARAYRRAGFILEKLNQDIALIYKQGGVKELEKMQGIGNATAKKIEEYLKTGKIKKFQELKNETAIQQIITHYFQTKGVGLKELKTDAKKKKIVYSRFTKPAKQLIELAGSVEKAKQAISTVADWAKSRNLDYAIETVFKKWLELDKLKPKEIVKKPFYEGRPMVWSQTKQKWYVISQTGEWLEFADKESKILWRIVK